jgi:hypothetical protein
LAVESPYQQMNGVLQRMLGLEQSVASLEQMTRTMAEAVEGFWAVAKLQSRQREPSKSWC